MGLLQEKTEQNRATAIQFITLLSAGDVDGFIALYHPEASLWTSGTTLISGRYTREQIEATAHFVFDAFPNGLAFFVRGVTADGDRVAVEAESEGEHISGVVYQNLYHFLFEFKDGKVLCLKEYMDTERVTEVLCGGQRPSK
ncbi:nuclear transport factor 2 family protein [uncultured Zhongshania sp.]|jgi:ketosteroid isomerase-like protein|uniref:nuclear transport factor 2 family protein n=1 Tax=uncultured Zhongshania sp. TaxID=1642288 RepID=UPI0025F21D38|nr:nuclear transport factor 2 family protein [uncultured Zhongshania sp.]|tara:strand:- start:2077 stop:2502 length:426 start_codon:yes stop_codon:yes gene_type:complete